MRRFTDSLAMQPVCHGNHFVPIWLRFSRMLAPKYDVDVTTQYSVIANFACILYLTL